jgi:hypothetical protein
MAVSTANAVLRQVIGNWRDSLMGVRGRQDAGDVKSSLEDICIDARVGTNALPASLHALYTEASDRVRRQGRGGYPNPFDVAELTRTASEALGQL